jgi:hypothetical protein
MLLELIHKSYLIYASHYTMLAADCKEEFIAILLRTPQQLGQACLIQALFYLSWHK